MAIGYVQGKAGGVLSSSVQSVTVTLDNPSTIHNLLIATVSTKHTGTTFTAPANWVQQLTVSAQVQTETYFTYVDNPGGLTSFAFTMTDTADGMSATVAEFSGMGTTISVDKTANANSASSTTMDSGTTATTTNAVELWYGALAYGSGSTKVISAVTNGFTAPAELIANAAITGNAHGAHISNYYKIPGTTGTADVGATLATASTSIGMMLTLISTDTSSGTIGVATHGQWPSAPLRSTQRVALTKRTHNAYTDINEQDAVPAAAEQFYGDGTQPSVMGRIHTAWPNSPVRTTTRTTLTWKAHNSGTDIAENELTSDPTGTVAEFYGLVDTYGTVLSDATIPVQSNSVTSATAQLSAPGTLQSTSVLSESVAQLSAPATSIATSTLVENALVVSPSGDALIANAALVETTAQVLSPASLIGSSLLSETSALISAPATLASTAILAQSSALILANGDTFISNGTLGETAQVVAPATLQSTSVLSNTSAQVNTLATAIANAVLAENVAQVLSPAPLVSTSVLSETSGLISAPATIASNTALAQILALILSNSDPLIGASTIGETAQIVTLSDPLVSSSVLSEAAQIVASAILQSNSILSEINLTIVIASAALSEVAQVLGAVVMVSNAIISATGTAIRALTVFGTPHGATIDQTTPSGATTQPLVPMDTYPVGLSVITRPTGGSKTL